MLPTYNDIFKTREVGSLPPPSDGKVICIESDMPLLEAVKLMAANNISACPVVDVEKKDDPSWRERYLGFLDMVGITFHILDILKDVQSRGGGIETLRKDTRLTKMASGELVASAHWTPFVPLTPSNTMLDVMLITGRFGFHRLPVITDAGDLSNIITQSAVVKYLVDVQEGVKELTSKTLAELGFDKQQEVISVNSDASLEDAIQLLRDHHLSALPVLGVGNAVIGNISARDLRNLIIDSRLFLLLSKSVRYFIAATSEVEHEAMNPAITCKPSDTLGRVMRQLCVSKIHRIYVVDSESKPIRVVSLSDILQLFVSEPPGYLAASFDLS